MRILLLLLLAVSQPGLAMELVTPSGKLQGAASPRSSDIAVFKGIPYAVAPTGARRWTYAERHPGWQGYVMPLDLVQPVRNIPIRKVRFLHAPRNLPARIVCISTFGHQCRRATRYR